MTKWTVKLEGVYPGTEDDFILSFNELSKPLLTVERYIVQDILDATKKKSHYSELPNVKEVASDKSDSLSHERIAVILATMKAKKEQVGILLYLNDELKYEVRGLRPDTFTEEIRSNHDKLKEILQKLGEEPNAFDDVNLILPEDRF